MARGRMINSKIASDAKIHRLSDDTSRLAFTWLITFADVEGRVYGDPAMVRSLLFPRRTDVTAEQMESYIVEWQAAGMIDWYEAEGDRWIQFVNFEKNQAGLRQDKEPRSTIPENNSGQLPENGRTTSGNDTEEARKKDGLREEKRTEEKRKEDKLIEGEVGTLTPFTTEFTRMTGIQEMAFSRHDIDALIEMHKAGVKVEDFVEAIHILQGKNFTVSGPASVKKTALSVMGKHKSGGAPPAGTEASAILFRSLGPG